MAVAVRVSIVDLNIVHRAWVEPALHAEERDCTRRSAAKESGRASAAIADGCQFGVIGMLQAAPTARWPSSGPRLVGTFVGSNRRLFSVAVPHVAVGIFVGVRIK